MELKENYVSKWHVELGITGIHYMELKVAGQPSNTHRDPSNPLHGVERGGYQSGGIGLLGGESITWS